MFQEEITAWCEDGKEQGRPRNRTKSWEAGAQEDRKVGGSPLVSQVGPCNRMYFFF